MTNVLVTFSSIAEQHVYQPIVQSIKGATLQIVSVERDPEQVDDLLKQQHHLVIAGSANGAHLPAVIAAKTTKPVIGVPVKSHFDGVDALLSMLQMPAGVPILTVGVNQVGEASRLAKKVTDQYEYVNLFGLTGNEKAKTCKAFLEKFNINYEVSDVPNEHAININFTSLSTPDIAQSDALIINVPIAKQNSIDTVKSLLETTRKQFWVGVNRGDSAAIAAMQILNLDGRYESEINAFRESLKSVKADNVVTYKTSKEELLAIKETAAVTKKLAEQTYNHNTITEEHDGVGQFRFNKNKFDNPVLVTKTKSIQAKAEIAAQAGMHETIGADLVHHLVNEVVAIGADPLFITNQLSVSSINPNQIEKILKGVTLACAANETVLLNQDISNDNSAKEGTYNLVGTILGSVEKDARVSSSKVIPGDIVIGLGSNGLHTSGFDLAKKVLLDMAEYKLKDSIPELGATLQDALLRTNQCYSKPVKQTIKNHLVKAMAHISDGGLKGSLQKILPKTCNVELDKDSWTVDSIFSLIAEKGNIPEQDMYETFNMGIGFVIVAPKNEADIILKELHARNTKAYKIGIIKLGRQEVAFKQGGFFSKIFGKKNDVKSNHGPQPVSMELIQKGVDNTLAATNYALGEKVEGIDDTYEWYLRDNYRIRIATDKVILNNNSIATIPFKGQVVNQLAVFWWNKTKDIVQSAAAISQDPNVTILKPYEEIGLKVQVHQYLTGNLYEAYKQGNVKCFEGNLSENVKQFQRFDMPIVTLKRKGECVAKEDILDQEILSESDLQKIERYAHDLFRRGTEVAAKRGLVLVNAAYEFGKIGDKVVLTNEVHTPNSSSYWFEESLASLHQGDTPVEVTMDIGNDSDELTADEKVKIAKQYTDLYEAMTGQRLLVQNDPIIERVEQNIARSLQNIAK